MIQLLKRRVYHNLNRITISSQALRENFAYFSQTNPHAEIAPVLKANAYGHGLVPIGQWIDKNLKVPFICIDSMHEAYQLRHVGVRTPLLLIGYTFPQNFHTYKALRRISFPVWDQDSLESLNTFQPGASIHLKIDTGMNRLGLLENEIPQWLKLLKTYRRIKIDGIYTHLSKADDPKDYQFTSMQVQTFKHVIKQFESAGYSFKWKHISASAAAVPDTRNHIADPDFNLIRLGLGFYGYNPLTIKKSLPLTPALTLESHLVQIKNLSPGNQVGYGGSYTITKPSTIGIVPLGYADGLDRRLSNKGIVQVETEQNQILTAPIIGRVCMNMTIIKLPANHNWKVGNRVKIISSHNPHPNSITSQARQLNTIPYEILTRLNPTIKRVISSD